jgi:hypothetical protein
LNLWRFDGEALDNPGFSRYLAIYVDRYYGIARFIRSRHDLSIAACKTTSDYVASIKLYKVLMKAALSNVLAARQFFIRAGAP